MWVPSVWDWKESKSFDIHGWFQADRDMEERIKNWNKNCINNKQGLEKWTRRL